MTDQFDNFLAEMLAPEAAIIQAAQQGLKPCPKSLSIELKFSFYLLNQSTAEIIYFSAGANTSMGKFLLQN